MNTTRLEDNPFDSTGHDSGASASTPTWGSPTSHEPPRGTGTDSPAPGAVPPAPTGTAQGPRPAPAAGFFDSIRRFGVVRPFEGRLAAGVCAGLARKWGMSRGLVRFLFVLLSLFAGVGLALYGLLWLLLPHPDGRIHAQQALAGTVTAGFIGSLLAILFGGPAGGPWDRPWHHGPGIFPLILVGLLVWWLTGRRAGHPGR
jgi:phage shock protein PspC (stress-responsive transcriptional regulator)